MIWVEMSFVVEVEVLLVLPPMSPLMVTPVMTPQ
jgi:hypothetical protein